MKKITQIAGVGGTPAGLHSANGWSYNITHASITLSQPTVNDITGGVLTFAGRADGMLKARGSGVSPLISRQ